MARDYHMTYKEDWDIKTLPIPIDEIVSDYRLAANRDKQIDILAELCGTKPCRIAWILSRCGLEVKQQKLPRVRRDPGGRDCVKLWETGPDALVCDRIRKRLEEQKAESEPPVQPEKKETEKEEGAGMAENERKMFETEDAIIRKLEEAEVSNGNSEKTAAETAEEVSFPAEFAWGEEAAPAEEAEVSNGNSEELSGADKRRGILTEAAVCVCSDRNLQYGEPEDNFDVIAALWSAYLGIPLKAKDVADMMILFKVGRVVTAEKPSRDSYVDIAGYAACAGGMIG